MRIILVFAALVVTTATAFCQTPYSGMQTRPIKALSEQQVADLQAGRGMGLALAAELNGYPGPSHVLELADKLGLTAEQRRQVEALFASMKQEAELDRQFSARTITPQSLKSATAAIAATQGELRETHLKYHLSTVAMLSESQRQQYSALRGYGHGAQKQHHHN
jgi:hypothetical protein